MGYYSNRLQNPLSAKLYTDGTSLYATASLLFATDATYNVGASGGNRPYGVYATNYIGLPGYAYMDRTQIVLFQGLGGINQRVIGTLYDGARYCGWHNSALVTIGSGTGIDAANLHKCLSVFDIGTATWGNNPTTIRLHSFGWTDNADVFHEEADVRLNGDLYINRQGNGQASCLLSLTEETTIAAAATTDTTIQIPAGALVYAVSFRVTTVIPTAATMDIGVAGATDRYHNDVAVAATTTGAGTGDSVRYYAAAAAIRITPNATPADNTGRVRVTIHYILVTPPTS